MDLAKTTSAQRTAVIEMGWALVALMKAYLKAVKAGVEFPPETNRAMSQLAVHIMGPKAPPEREQ